MIRKILLGDRAIEYDLQIKKVKNINIRIKRDLSVHVSASSRVPLSKIERILSDKSDFILSAIAKYEELAKKEQTRPQSGDFVAVFGKPLPIVAVAGKKNQAIIYEDKIVMTLKDTSDTKTKEKALSSALETLLQSTVEEICRKVYPNFAGYIPDFPALKFRHMKSRWGSCNYKKYILTFNCSLVHAPIECIEYVVLHEFTHFIHPNHSKDFYRELSRFSPRYKELKKALENSR